MALRLVRLERPKIRDLRPFVRTLLKRNEHGETVSRGSVRVWNRYHAVNPCTYEMHSDLRTTGLITTFCALGWGSAWAEEAKAPGAARVEPPLAAVSELPEPGASAWTLQLSAATEFPVFAGGTIVLEGPAGLQLGGGFGAVPDPYLNAAGSAVTSLANLGGEETDLIRQALNGRWAARAFIGWRPVRTSGFYLRLGYQATRLSADLGSSEVLGAVTGLPASVSVSADIQAVSTLHMMYGELGYRWKIKDFTVRASLGFVGTLGAQVDLEVNAPASEAIADQLATAGETYLQDSLRSYVMTPTLGLAIGYDIGL